MEFWEHLEELRWVIFKSLIAITIGTAICLTFTAQIYHVLLYPLHTIGDAQKIVLRYDGPLDAFLIKLKMGLLGGVVLAAPAVFYFLWTFVAPGLLERERRAVRTALTAGFGFFLAGVGFGYYLLSLVLPILLRFSDPGVQNLWRLKTYMDFAFRLLLGVGAAFELPVVLTVLVRLGILDVRKLQKGRPYAVVITMTVAAILTPPDPFTQLMLGVPMILLYEISVLAAKWQERVMARQRAEEEKEEAGEGSAGSGTRDGPSSFVPADATDGAGVEPSSALPDSSPDEVDDLWPDDDAYAPDEEYAGPEEAPADADHENGGARADAPGPMEKPRSGDTVNDRSRDPTESSGPGPSASPAADSPEDNKE